MDGVVVFIVGGDLVLIFFFRVVWMVWYMYLRDWWGGLFFWC